MPVPFRDLTGEEDSGLAGFLRFEAEAVGRGVRAGLFIVSGRGEPVEFSFTRVNVTGSFLWRAGEAHRNAVSSLARALFEATSGQPDLLLALADEVPPRIFTEDLEVRVPICRIATGDTLVHAQQESLEILPDAINLFWIGGIPEEGSKARRLLTALQLRQLLMEPFERASIGLREAFRDS